VKLDSRGNEGSGIAGLGFMAFSILLGYQLFTSSAEPINYYTPVILFIMSLFFLRNFIKGRPS